LREGKLNTGRLWVAEHIAMVFLNGIFIQRAETDFFGALEANPAA